jgi:hypothetical protein
MWLVCGIDKNSCHSRIRVHFVPEPTCRLLILINAVQGCRAAGHTTFIPGHLERFC